MEKDKFQIEGIAIHVTVKILWLPKIAK